MLATLLDLLFPARCIGCKKFGTLLCDNCFTTISYDVVKLCPVCNKNSVTGATHPICVGRYTLDGLTSGVMYRGVVKKLVYKFKYAPYLSSLEEIIGKLLYESIIQDELCYKKLSSATLFIPVPLYAKRFKTRGYNHAALLTKGLGKELLLPVLENALVRTRATLPQFKLTRDERYKNLKGAFEINSKYKEKIKGQNIILIDDLATSCATLNECANLLKRNGAKSVWAITFARE